MQKTLKLLPVITLLIINSCSFANKSTVMVPINSNPPGADVVIDGKNYGQTPVFAELKPSKNYKATISKQGYGSANIDMETWYSLRDVDGADGKRCLADSQVLGIPYFIVLLFSPEKCGSFKQADYFVDLTGGRSAMTGNSESQNNQPNNGYYGGRSQYQNNGQNHLGY